MGLGIAQASPQTMSECNATHSLVNQYLDDQEPELSAQLDALHADARTLAENEAQAPLPSVLRARARASELTLKAAQSRAERRRVGEERERARRSGGAQAHRKKKK